MVDKDLQFLILAAHDHDSLLISESRNSLSFSRELERKDLFLSTETSICKALPKDYIIIHQVC